MMAGTSLDLVPIDLMLLVIVALTLASLEIGYRIGCKRRDSPDKEKEGPVATTVSAEMTLLARIMKQPAEACAW